MVRVVTRGARRLNLNKSNMQIPKTNVRVDGLLKMTATGGKLDLRQREEEGQEGRTE